MRAEAAAAALGARWCSGTALPITPSALIWSPPRASALSYQCGSALRLALMTGLILLGLKRHLERFFSGEWCCVQEDIFICFKQQPKKFMNPKIRLSDPLQCQSIVDAEWNIIYDKLDKCAKSAAKIVLSPLAIGDLATQEVRPLAGASSMELILLSGSSVCSMQEHEGICYTHPRKLPGSEPCRSGAQLDLALMGKSPAKQIKSVLFRKKSSSRSASTEAKDLSLGLYLH